ncbi:hypothetical protein ACSBR2_012928 [Camellia fascicularis]
MMMKLSDCTGKTAMVVNNETELLGKQQEIKPGGAVAYQKEGSRNENCRKVDSKVQGTFQVGEFDLGQRGTDERTDIGSITSECRAELLSGQCGQKITHTAIIELEDRARKCYAEETSILGLGVDSDQFVEMMLLDGFFIIELFRTFTMFCMLGESQQNFQAFQTVQLLLAENDHIFQSSSILFAMGRDLILLENQLPFFILNRLFDITNSDSNLGIIQIALDFLKHVTPQNELQAPSGISIDNVKHLLDLVHNCWCNEMNRRIEMFDETNRNGTRKKWEFINSATRLQEAGVQFKKVEGSNLFDIKFISGALEIPLFSITEFTESFLTNLVACEL